MRNIKQKHTEFLKDYKSKKEKNYYDIDFNNKHESEILEKKTKFDLFGIWFRDKRR